MNAYLSSISFCSQISILFIKQITFLILNELICFTKSKSSSSNSLEGSVKKIHVSLYFNELLTSEFKNKSNLFLELWKPGVSIKIIWESSSW